MMIRGYLWGTRLRAPGPGRMCGSRTTRTHSGGDRSMNATVAVPKRGSTLFTYVLAALAGLMFGLDIGVISGAEQFIQSYFHISDNYIEWIVSIMMWGAATGAAGAGWLS